MEYAPKDCYHSIPCKSRAKTQRKNFEIYDSHVMVLNDWRRRNRNCLCKSDAVLIKKYDDHIGNLWSYINRIRRYEMKSKLSTCLKFDACIWWSTVMSLILTLEISLEKIVEYCIQIVQLCHISKLGRNWSSQLVAVQIPANLETKSQDVYTSTRFGFCIVL